MTNHQDIVEKLSQFNNVSFTKKQWEIILKGCGCPKSAHFWTVLRQNNLIQASRVYTLVEINSKTFTEIWESYCLINRECVKRSQEKAKARKKARERINAFKGITFYTINGVLCTELPDRD